MRQRFARGFGKKAAAVLRYSVDSRNQPFIEGDVEPDSLARSLRSNKQARHLVDFRIALYLVEIAWTGQFLSLSNGLEQVAGKSFLSV